MRPGELVPGDSECRRAVMIPSFHRPGIIRYDLNNNTVNDWTRQNQSNPSASESLGRLGGADPAAVQGGRARRDDVPGPESRPGTRGRSLTTWTMTATASTDSVWLDLGYPARKDSSGRLYKPLFAFMVIGLNGRIPLNTAGNLAAQVAGLHAQRPAGRMPSGDSGQPSTVYGGTGTRISPGQLDQRG